MIPLERRISLKCNAKVRLHPDDLIHLTNDFLQGTGYAGGGLAETSRAGIAFQG
jgi:hypothetical protein